MPRNGQIRLNTNMSIETTQVNPEETDREQLPDYSEYVRELSPPEITPAPRGKEIADAREMVQVALVDSEDNEARTGTIVDMSNVADWDMATARERLGTEYDHSVEVDGKTMNVNIQGDGDRFVVILPGRGVTAPSCDFAPLIAQLKDSCKVATIEPFGSGLRGALYESILTRLYHQPD